MLTKVTKKLKYSLLEKIRTASIQLRLDLIVISLVSDVLCLHCLFSLKLLSESKHVSYMI